MCDNKNIVFENFVIYDQIKNFLYVVLPQAVKLRTFKQKI